MMRKLTVHLNGNECERLASEIFEIRVTSTGKPQIILDVPDNHADLLRRLANLLPPPFYVLYVLHTPRGEGVAGRYQSSELTMHELNDFLHRYGSFFANDGRHDLWVHSPGTGHTLVWDRHNLLIVEGEPLDDVKRALVDLGFREGQLQPLGDHFHHYRAEFDNDAISILEEIDWRRTPLRPEDKQ